ncbi:hypothetical protein BABINDRAFT_162324 [Babjeviella inositovora NRRL Y-12698]|uniref:SWR1-complex protein 4 n=1 Tax=Babjeviella inositovora NRRL Y-12698 TaxID=984486 RepID=A0A1E3QQQ8_9ASCO|nr:uncharacterized protein BABINDRAFT_162324 [Babjeviella inositovora NRRL Y-12698]ODQ79297.1 hypothetical protein BABINDRAFT_162324 [Babjeviella inositovora NRRL Y-12698]
MSTSDVLDVLNVQRNSQPTQKKRVTATKKQAGINRELYNLLGANTPSVQLTPTLRFKDRIHAIQKPRLWRYETFQNGARTDGLELSHWVKEDVAGPYPFEKYNTKLPIPRLFEDDYDEFLAREEQEKKESDKPEDEQPEEPWSFAETQYLFGLCEMYDLRWVVIHDRYEYETFRSMEDLKAQFYRLSAQILAKRAAETGSNDETTKATIEALNSFDKLKELNRKEYLTKLLSRSSAEIAEEESLVIEARKFEMSAKKMLTERLQLLKLLDSPQSASTAQFQTSQGLAQLYNALMVSDKHKKRKAETPPVAPVMPAIKREKLSSGISPLQQYLKAHILGHSHEESHSPVAQLLSRKLTPRDEALYGLSFQEKIAPGISLRSARVHTFKPTVQAKVGALLTELQIPAKPVMPTMAVAEKFDELTKAIGVLMDIKRQKDKLEAELKVLKNLKGR